MIALSQAHFFLGTFFNIQFLLNFHYQYPHFVSDFWYFECQAFPLFHDITYLYRSCTLFLFHRLWQSFTIDSSSIAGGTCYKHKNNLMYLAIYSDQSFTLISYYYLYIMVLCSSLGHKYSLVLLYNAFYRSYIMQLCSLLTYRYSYLTFAL